MTSKEALKKLEYATNWSSEENIDKDLYNLWGNVACRTIKKDLELLEELEILKKYYPPFKEFLEEMFEKGYNEDLTKIKEWLKNDI